MTDDNPDTDDHRVAILIVDDERALADLYAEYLRDAYDVRTAYSGEAAIEKLDGVDVVLLDRRMPGLSGDDALEAIRSHDSSLRVAMVTAVEPDYDIVEMGFDDYLTKPVDAESLHETVEHLLALSDLESRVREYVALSLKQVALEGSKTSVEWDDSEEYSELSDRLTALSAELGDVTAHMSEEAFAMLTRSIVRGMERGERAEPGDR